MAEQIFFEQGEIKITLARAIFGNHTYVFERRDFGSLRRIEAGPEMADLPYDFWRLLRADDHNNWCRMVVSPKNTACRAAFIGFR